MKNLIAVALLTMAGPLWADKNETKDDVFQQLQDEARKAGVDVDSPRGDGGDIKGSQVVELGGKTGAKDKEKVKPRKKRQWTRGEAEEVFDRGGRKPERRDIVGEWIRVGFVSNRWEDRDDGTIDMDGVRPQERGGQIRFVQADPFAHLGVWVHGESVNHLVDRGSLPELRIETQGDVIQREGEISKRIEVKSVYRCREAGSGHDHMICFVQEFRKEGKSEPSSYYAAYTRKAPADKK